jgi:hypothetical protein
MDESQITGAASSYARKYALNGLLLIDDNKDADSMDNSGQPKASKSSNRERDAMIGRLESVQGNPRVIDSAWVKMDNAARHSIWPFLSEKTKQILTESGK